MGARTVQRLQCSVRYVGRRLRPSWNRIGRARGGDESGPRRTSRRARARAISTRRLSAAFDPVRRRERADIHPPHQALEIGRAGAHAVRHRRPERFVGCNRQLPDKPRHRGFLQSDARWHSLHGVDLTGPARNGLAWFESSGGYRRLFVFTGTLGCHHSSPPLRASPLSSIRSLPPSIEVSDNFINGWVIAQTSSHLLRCELATYRRRPSLGRRYRNRRFSYLQQERCCPSVTFERL
jgi:hypothetical protein